jgi:hypothetical protein
MGVVPSEGTAKVLADLLTVPRDPFRVVVRRNAILMYRPADRAAFTLAAGCLRA